VVTIIKDAITALDTVIRPLKQEDCRKYSLDLDRREILKVAEKKNMYDLNSSKGDEKRSTPHILHLVFYNRTEMDRTNKCGTVLS